MQDGVSFLMLLRVWGPKKLSWGGGWTLFAGPSIGPSEVPPVLGANVLARELPQGNTLFSPRKDPPKFFFSSF